MSGMASAECDCVWRSSRASFWSWTVCEIYGKFTEKKYFL